MNRWIVLLLICISINGYAQTELCATCEILAEGRSKFERKRYWNQCFDTDSSMVEDSVYEIRKKHKCKDYLLVELRKIGDTISLVSYDIKKSKDTTFMRSEKFPEFRGGMSAYMSYMSQNIRYPRAAERKEIEGRVEVLFYISKTGKVYGAKVYKGVEPSLDEEAVRIFSEMPDWTPGEYKGKAVVYKYIAPIRFKMP